MKNYLKHIKKENVLISIIILAALFVRFYNFLNRVTFWSEQARSLITSYDYLHKFSLLGQEYFRQDSYGHTIFSGAWFNYSLVPIILLAHKDPIIITAYFAILNVLTGFLIYFLARKMFSKNVALISLILFLFNDFMIYHSLFIWNYNYLPLVGAFAFYYLFRARTHPDLKTFFILGLIGGVGLSLQVLFAPLVLITLAVGLYNLEGKLKYAAFFAMGITLGNLPMFLFDFRHSFYQTQTLAHYLLDTFSGKNSVGFSYYYFLPFWPLGVIMLAFVLEKILKINKYFGVLLVALYLILNLDSKRVSWNKPAGMPDGVTVQELELASRGISKDAKGEFNVAEVLDFDKRAYVLRYLIVYQLGKNILSETSYPNSKLMYVLAPKNYDFRSSGVWEINSGGPYNVNKLSDVGELDAIYKLTKL